MYVPATLNKETPTTTQRPDVTSKVVTIGPDVTSKVFTIGL